MTVANRGLMVWPDTYGKLETIRTHGRKISQVGLFFFEINADGTITDTLPSNAASVAATWPHITWLLTVMNHGFESRWRSLLTDTTAQDTFIASLSTLLDTYTWADGIDVDLERGPVDLEDEIYTLYQRIYNTVKAKGKHVHLDLPPMEGARNTVGPEKWCVYERLAPLCDTAQIMAYGFAWAGSGVGPTTPVSWLRRVMAYATSAFDKSQVFMGAPAYGHRWQIYGYPDQPGVYPTGPYRGVGAGFEPFLDWMLGKLSHTDANRSGTETQKYVPFASFWDQTSFHHNLHLHIYDYPGAGDQDTLNSPLVQDSFDREFLTCYAKQQKATFTGLEADVGATAYDTKEGALDEGGGAVWARNPQQIGTDPNTGQPIMEEEGSATYSFSVAGGTYDVVVEVLFPWWDKQTLTFALDGVNYTVGNKPQWYPYHRQRHWIKLGSVTLAAGAHTFEFLGDSSSRYTYFYGLRVCANFTSEHYGGTATLTVRPRQFYDVNKALAWPNLNRFKLTLETMRRPPDYALIWYDDFRDWPAGDLPSANYLVLSGTWTVNKDPTDTSPRPRSWLTGSGEFQIGHSGFANIAVKSHLTLDGTGKAGVTFADLWLCLNPATGRLELYQGATLLGYYATGVTVGTAYTILLRVRGTEVCGFVGNAKVITATATVGSGAFGIKTEDSITTDLLVAGDSYMLYPQEAIDVTLPNGTVQTIGRIPRTGVIWDSEWEMFQLNSGEEYDTRSPGPDGLPVGISMEWDFIHSQVFTLAAPGDYTVTVKARDVGAWVSTLYLGDADGFSLAVFPDAETILRLGDMAAYEFQVQGMGMWNIGLEDPQLWQMLVDHA